MSGINFKGVEKAKESTMTRPGVIDVFEIKEVKFDTTPKKGTYYMGVSFSRKADNFSHSFFLSEKALPRVKSLVEYATGKSLEEELQEDQLIALLTGKKLGLKVTGKIDPENGRAYPDLSFGGFGCIAADVEKLVFNEVELEKNEKAKAALASASIANAESADSPMPAATPATKKEDDNPF